MKYFKFTQIDAETGISWAISQPRTGPSWPSIPGLQKWTTLSHDPMYHVAIVDDSAEANPENHFFELTKAEYARELNNHITNWLNQEKGSIYGQEIEFRNAVFGKYHDTASVAGIYKYEQAKEVLEDANAAALEVRAEAGVRGISVEEMANRIVNNHEDFRAKEAKIAGIRGKILDRIDSFVFDDENPDDSLADFESLETIGTTTEKKMENMQFVDVSVDVKVRKYSLSLQQRFLFG